MVDKMTECVFMLIAKTASRNIATKAGKMSEAVLDAQASFVTTETTGQDRTGGFVRARVA